MTDPRDNFAKALRDELSSSERAEFERAIEADPALASELEAFSDARAGELENVTSWLEHTGHAGAIEYRDAYDHMVKDVIERAYGRKRGRLIQLVGAVGAVAAAAAVVAILIMPAKTVTEDWPDANTESVQVMYDNYLHYSADVEKFTPAEGITLSIHNGALIRPHERGARLDRGTVVVKLEDGALYHIDVGDRRIEATGPAEFKVTVEPHRFTDTQFLKPEKDPMLDSRLLSRIGAQGFALTLSVIAGSATLHGAQAPQQVNAPHVVQAQANPPKPHQPPKVEDLFDHLDGNSDGKLDNAEVPQHMIDDFDDDSSGDIDLTEFKAHHKPPKPGMKPEDHFAELDKNSDGKLDSVEIPQKMIDDMDDDNSGDVDLTEFKANHKPPQPVGQPKPEDHFDHLDLNGDGKLDNTELPQDMLDDMDDDSSGDVDLDEFKANHKPPLPPKPEDEFARLDKNSDGKLDSNETDQKMINDFDDDSSGDIDLTEFKDHWRPHPKKPEDAFRDLDKNADGKLDSTELPQALVNDWDDDSSGDVDLDEFKDHHKPAPPPPAGPGNGPGGKGPGGPGNGPPPGGKGPGGPGNGPPPGGKGPGPKPPRK
ncbi:MAG: hypothetical protein K8I27_09280 [Planctomycetes bacterium]|nr:hypothetical protein [Planctomycetota bacterium]